MAAAFGALCDDDVGAGRELLELQLGEAGVEAVRILREERVQRGLVADLQREFVVAAGLGLRARRRRHGSSRGRLARRLVGLKLAAPVPEGAEVKAESAPVGSATNCCTW